ncbi:DDE-type integrase/transposase/recombinase [Spirillospora sp. NBC_01491]|uniref:DDE-type integrase/transposase/recombinase n=1 Tax=Spirillospora sp. NBC_01491 TaxID=2976007 RepID=UPI003FA7DDA3
MPAQLRRTACPRRVEAWAGRAGEPQAGRTAHARGRHPGDPRRKGRRNLVNEPTEEDLVQRAFDARAPDLLWVTDITEHPTVEGKLYCAAVLDCFSRRIVGHSIDIRQASELVIDAMAASVARRNHRPAPRSCTPTTERNSLPGRSGNACETRGCSAQWARSATVSTMQ